MSHRRSVRVVTAVAVSSAAALLAPATVLASPEGGQKGFDSIEWITPVFGHSGSLGLVWAFINFAILAWILEKIMFSKLRARTRDKHDAVKKEIDEATSAKQEAQDVLAEYKGKIDALDAEIESLMSDAKERAEADRKRIIADAEREAEQIKASAKASAEREAAARRRQLEAEIVDRAIDKAEALLRSKMSPTDQRGMVDRYVDQLASVDFGGRPS